MYKYFQIYLCNMNCFSYFIKISLIYGAMFQLNNITLLATTPTSPSFRHPHVERSQSMETKCWGNERFKWVQVAAWCTYIVYCLLQERTAELQATQSALDVTQSALQAARSDLKSVQQQYEDARYLSHTHVTGLQYNFAAQYISEVLKGNSIAS